MDLNRKPEVLAPAGTLETVRAVIDAGADAVYLGGKGLNMRQHRSSYNLSDEELAEAIAIAHGRDRKLYFTLNSLILEDEVAQLRQILSTLGELCPDAIIVQDLGAAAMAREICVHVPLHASTMMNVHSAASAATLSMIGFTRAITSRDIPLHEVRRIGEVSGLEMEYFVHGDMCVAQSAQCHLSGILFGKSANFGRCMKPCRWQWRLRSRGGAQPGEMNEGFLLARKDMCLFQHIPQLVQNGIVSLKIEGRMRSTEFLTPIVAAFREAVDAYFEDPHGYATSAETMADLWNKRVRELTTSHAFRNPGPVSIDPTGRREPRFFSHRAPQPTLSAGRPVAMGEGGGQLELIAHVADIPAARAAADAGADAVYLTGDRLVRHPACSPAEVQELVEQLAGRHTRLGVLSPRICDERDMAEWRWWLGQLSPVLNSLTVGAGNLGALQVAAEAGGADILADFGCNATNSVAVDELSTMGATRVTASVELTFDELRAMATATRLPVEAIGQGPLPGMLLEHCMIAATAGISPQDVCPIDCAHGQFELQDPSGQSFRVECDRRCRNHIYTAADVTVLPSLAELAGAGVAGIRVEGQLDVPDVVAAVVAVYRVAIDSLRVGQPVDVPGGIDRIRQAVNRPLGDGPLARLALHPAAKNAMEVSQVVQ